MKNKFLQKKNTFFNKQTVMHFNQSLLENLLGSELPDKADSIKVANRLGLLILIFLLFQFCIVVSLVLKVWVG